MLCKIAFKNIRKSLKDYLVYFLTLCLAVACFYMFNSLDSQTAVMKMDESAYENMKLLMRIISAASVLVAIVLGFLIVSSNRYLIKRRKKEFGIYLTLGMGKRSVSGILLWETVLIGLISLGVGLCLGIFGSQLMSVFTAKMFKADLSGFHFVFSKDAFIKSCIYYGIIYGVVLVFNTFTVGNLRLISLLQARSKNEKSGMKNSVVSLIVFAASLAALIYAYVNAAGGVRTIRSAGELTFIIVLLFVSTFFIFWSASGFVMNILMRFKGIWYKGTNMFVFRQLASKVNTRVAAMTFICLMMTFAIVSLGGSLSLKNGMEKNLEANTPADVNIFVYKDRGYTDNSTVAQVLERGGFDLKEFKESSEISFYNSDELTCKDFLGETLSDALANSPNAVTFTEPEDVVRLSEYNGIARLYGHETFELSENEYICVCDYANMTDIRNKALKTGGELVIGGKSYRPKFSECKEGFVLISGANTNTGIIVVPDEADLFGFENTKTVLAANYDADSKEERLAIDAKLTDNALYDKALGLKGGYYWETKTGIYSSYAQLVTIVLFVAIYIGITFLIASAALLSLNQLTESEDNVHNYGILRKIGCDESTVNAALFKQSGIFFITPLILAVIHSVIGLRFFASMLDGIYIGGSLALSMTVTAAIIGGIYGAYFLASYAGSRRIIRG